MTVSVMAFTIEVGDAVPTTTGTVPGLVSGVTNAIHTPAPASGISVAHSPSGAVVTNVSRVNHATKTYMAASLNVLNVGTTPPPTGSLPTFKG